MKERPILFSTPMVRAILEGRKSQTRRIIKPQPEYSEGMSKWVLYPKQHPTVYADLINAYKYCPYGQPGDVLWVRETWFDAGYYFIYRADSTDDGFKWRPSIFMPKVASRLKLKVTDIRVERVQDITEEDALREGVEYMDNQMVEGEDDPCRIYCDYTDNETILMSAKSSYKSLWKSINGKDSWESNPWVWVIEFERI